MKKIFIVCIFIIINVNLTFGANYSFKIPLEYNSITLKKTGFIIKPEDITSRFICTANLGSNGLINGSCINNIFKGSLDGLSTVTGSCSGLNYQINYNDETYTGICKDANLSSENKLINGAICSYNETTDVWITGNWNSSIYGRATTRKIIINGMEVYNFSTSNPLINQNTSFTYNDKIYYMGKYIKSISGSGLQHQEVCMKDL